MKGRAASPWHKESKETVADAVFSEVQRVADATAARTQQMVDCFCYYGSLAAMGTSSVLAELIPDTKRLSNNVIANAVDSLAAELTQTIARPMFVSNGGSWSDFQRARQLTSWMDMEFDAHDADETSVRVVLDGLICGTGACRWVQYGERERLERLSPWHVLADDRACVDVMPRTFFLRQIVDKHHLADIYEDDRDKQAAILDASLLEHDEIWAEASMGSTDEMCSVYEAWRLGPKGRHVVAVSGATLLDEEFAREEPPICFYRPLPPARGYFGEAPIQRVIGLQLEINKLDRRIQDSMHLHSRLITFVDRQSRIARDQITNALAAIIEYEGRPPTFVPVQAMGADVYNQRKTYMSEVYDGLGVSEMGAKSTVPRGMADASGVALEIFENVESKRFINQKRRVDRFRVRLAEERTNLQRSEGRKAVLVKRRGVVRELRWGDIELPEDALHIRIQATGSLPASPAGKAKRLQEYVAANLLTPDEFMAVSDDPDLERVRALRMAPVERLEDMFEKMLSNGEGDADDAAADYEPPEPSMNLAAGIKMAMQYLNLAARHDVSDARQQLLRDWILAAKAELDKLNPPPPPAPPPDPMAAAMPMPVGPGIPPGGPLPPPGLPVPGPAPIPMGPMGPLAPMPPMGGATMPPLG